jgi:hypothetical protein
MSYKSEGTGVNVRNREQAVKGLTRLRYEYTIQYQDSVS